MRASPPAAAVLMRRKAAAAAVLAVLCSAGGAQAGRGARRSVTAATESLAAELRPRVESAKAVLQRSLIELEEVVVSLEELSKTYPSSPDLEATASAREALVRQAALRLSAADRSRRDLDELHKSLQARQGMRLLGEAAEARKAVPKGRTAAGPGRFSDVYRSGLDELLGIGEVISRAKTRRNALEERLKAEQAAFEREREARARVKAMRLAALGVLGLAVLVGGALLWRRGRA